MPHSPASLAQATEPGQPPKSHASQRARKPSVLVSTETPSETYPLSKGSSQHQKQAVLVALLHPPTHAEVALRRCCPQLLLISAGAARSVVQRKPKKRRFLSSASPALPSFCSSTPSPPWKLAVSRYEVFLKRIEEYTMLVLSLR